MLLHSRQSSTQNNKYQVSHNTAVSPDDGHIVARNVYRLINILRINILRIDLHHVGFIYKIIR